MRKSQTSRRGAVVVETAILLPFLMIVTFGSIDLAQYINTGQAITNTSREGARAASRNRTQSVSEVEAAAMAYLRKTIPSLPDDGVTITVMEVIISDCGTEKQQIPSGDMGKVESGNAISICVEMDFSEVRWLPGIPFRRLKTETICRRE